MTKSVVTTGGRQLGIFIVPLCDVGQGRHSATLLSPLWKRGARGDLIKRTRIKGIWGVAYYLQNLPRPLFGKEGKYAGNLPSRLFDKEGNSNGKLP
jgi:hypothetical protein